MDKLKDYIKKNLVFIGLLSVVIIIMIALVSYSLINNQKQSGISQKPLEEEPLTQEAAVISSIQGTYGKDEQVRLTWSITPNNDVITSVKLLTNGNQIGGEMKNLNSFTLLQSLYQFPTGNNTFLLQVNTERGEVIEKSVDVFIDYVLGATMGSEEEEDGVIVKLSYEYDKNNTVGVPRLQLSNTGVEPFEVSYVETTKTEVGSHIRAESSYKIATRYVKNGVYKIHFRWIFDGLNSSYDFDLDITKK